jgi:hypothetical protein
MSPDTNRANGFPRLRVKTASHDAVVVTDIHEPGP